MRQKKKAHANTLVNSLRGQYIISQALCIAVRALRKRPKHQQEPNNVADMELLITHVYPIFRVVEEAREAKKHEDKE